MLPAPMRGPVWPASLDMVPHSARQCRLKEGRAAAPATSARRFVVSSSARSQFNVTRPVASSQLSRYQTARSYAAADCAITCTAGNGCMHDTVDKCEVGVGLHPLNLPPLFDKSKALFSSNLQCLIPRAGDSPCSNWRGVADSKCPPPFLTAGCGGYDGRFELSWIMLRHRFRPPSAHRLT